ESQTPIQSKIKKQNVDSEDPGNALVAHACLCSKKRPQFFNSMLATSGWQCHEGLLVAPRLDVSCLQ
ncbi:MAG: hypothetical protein QF512_16805, partial [Alphaproteobacteria bacterium]|nr:hypothetical protein [Alphaproteobacteria bacterium]